MKKKVLIALIALAAVACITLAVGVTVAYNTQENTGVNVVTMGDLKIAAVQMSIPEGEKTPRPFNGTFTFIPGRQESWILEVESRCRQDAYVRVAVQTVIALAEGVTGKPDPAMIELDFNTKNWEYKDGYYYYKTPLCAGKKTEPLFTAVRFSPEAGNLYQQADVRADIRIEATQVKNNGSNVFEAAGWPAED